MDDIAVDKRNAGCGVIFEDKLYVWGGETVDKRRPYQEMLDSDDEDEEPDIDPNLVIETVVTLPRPNDENHPFDVLDLNTRKWSRQPTSGSVPSVGNGSSLNVHLPSRSLLLYGGWNGGKFNAEIYRVSADDWKWEIVKPSTEIKPSPRYLTGVLMHKDRMCVFAGVGPDIIKDQDPGATYVAYVDSGVERPFGWNNEYYEFDFSTCNWEAPLGKKAFRPGPIGTFAFTKFDQHRALMFGGNGSRGRMNEVYIFDIDGREWNGAFTPSVNQPWPSINRFGTLTPLIDPDLVGHQLCGVGPVLKQTLVLLWGKDNHHHITTETWLLDVNSFPTLTWTKLNIPAKPRSWHIARPHYSQTSTSCDIVIFGGNVHIEGYYGDRENSNDLKVLSFGVSSLAGSCLSVIVKSDSLMAQLSTLPPAMQTQVRCAQEAQQKCPKITNITTVC